MPEKDRTTPGFWKTVGNSFMQDVAQRNARKAEQSRVKAGKTFHRTKRNLRKAERLERAVSRHMDAQR